MVDLRLHLNPFSYGPNFKAFHCLPDINSSELLTIMSIGFHLDPRDGKVAGQESWPSVARLCTMTKLSRTTVKRALSGLVQKRYIVRKPRYLKDASRSTNIYYLTDKVFAIYTKYERQKQIASGKFSSEELKLVEMEVALAEQKIKLVDSIPISDIPEASQEHSRQIHLSSMTDELISKLSKHLQDPIVSVVMEYPHEDEYRLKELYEGNKGVNSSLFSQINDQYGTQDKPIRLYHMFKHKTESGEDCFLIEPNRHGYTIRNSFKYDKIGEKCAGVTASNWGGVRSEPPSKNAIKSATSGSPRSAMDLGRPTVALGKGRAGPQTNHTNKPINKPMGGCVLDNGQFDAMSPKQIISSLCNEGERQSDDKINNVGYGRRLEQQFLFNKNGFRPFKEINKTASELVRTYGPEGFNKFEEMLIKINEQRRSARKTLIPWCEENIKVLKKDFNG